MAKVAAVVRDALSHLERADAAQAISAEDMADGIRALNLMMRAWEAEGLALGWSDVSGPDDDLPAPPEAEEAIGYNLALRLRARFGVALEADVVQLANDGLALLRAQQAANEYARLSYPDLPAGETQRRGSWRDGFSQ